MIFVPLMLCYSLEINNISSAYSIFTKYYMIIYLIIDIFINFNTGIYHQGV